VPALFEVGGQEFVPVVNTFQVQLVRLSVLRRPRRDRALLGPTQLCLQRFGNALRNLSFDREDVGEGAVVSLRPQMQIILR
jgi:hypothetical protein